MHHLFSENAEGNTWYVEFYTESIQPDAADCGRSLNKPCSKLQTVLNKIKPGDTVVLMDKKEPVRERLGAPTPTENPRKSVTPAQVLTQQELAERVSLVDPTVPVQQPITVRKLTHAASVKHSFILTTDITDKMKFSNIFYNLKLKMSTGQEVSIENAEVFNIHIDSHGGSLQVRDSTFDNSFLSTSSHRRSSCGSVMHVKNSLAEIVNSSFTENKIPASSCSEGLIDIAHSAVKIKNVKFHRNHEDGIDTKLLNVKGSNITMSDSKFTENLGGCMRIDGCSNKSICEKSRVGGSNVEISTSSFRKNSVKKQAGVINAGNNSVVIVKQSEFIENHAGEKGGVMVVEETSRAYFNDSKFEKNTAQLSGGVLYGISKTEVEIHNCSFIENRGLGSHSYGGVLGLFDFTNIRVYSSHFTKSQASTGSVVYAEDTRVEMSECSIIDNTAFGLGGSNQQLEE